MTKWAERGVGQLRLLVHKVPAEHHPRLVMRVEHVGRLILNEVILPMNDHAVRVSENSIRLVVVSGASDAQSYLFRVKTATEAELLLSKMNGLIIKEKEKA